jgi:hypothetical protein
MENRTVVEMFPRDAGSFHVRKCVPSDNLSEPFILKLLNIRFHVFTSVYNSLHGRFFPGKIIEEEGR